MSPRSDGCALFVRRSKCRLVSAHTLIYALPAEYSAGVEQKQVAIIAECEVVVEGAAGETGKLAPKVIVATTYLQEGKSAEGETVRRIQMDQLLAAVQQLHGDIDDKEEAHCAVLLMGDLNSRPLVASDYAAWAYAAIKSHALQFQSVYNDDAEAVVRYNKDKHAIGKEGIYTMWHAMMGDLNREEVTKYCIDYIVYSTVARPSYKKHRIETRLRAKAALDVFTAAEAGKALFPSAEYPSDHIAIAADFSLEWKYF